MAHLVDVHVGKRIRQRRWLVGMTQQKLAEAVGCAAPTIVSGAGHMLPSEHPFEVNKSIRKLIEG